MSTVEVNFTLMKLVNADEPKTDMVVARPIISDTGALLLNKAVFRPCRAGDINKILARSCVQR
ncbi:hypothetical protein [Acetomicrobium sp.]|uniref:hypothetical protein n=1 Tax=Acetomicrobium sp. TaxID=1872099 RepID=UPI002D047247|nr:hypothetical protein [Acetomicrobium sp.]HQC88241.1 hypothetical protein [Acetomicrobium sp.]